MEAGTYTPSELGQATHYTNGTLRVLDEPRDWNRKRPALLTFRFRYSDDEHYWLLVGERDEKYWLPS